MVIFQSDVDHNHYQYPRSMYVYEANTDRAASREEGDVLDDVPSTTGNVRSPRAGDEPHIFSTGESIHFLGGRKDVDQSYCVGMTL
jgi:hypothetical protein